MYIKKVRMNVECQPEVNTISKRRKDNLHPVERNAIWNLWQRTDIATKPAGKDSVVVVFTKEDYIIKVDRLLNNRIYYQ